VAIERVVQGGELIVYARAMVTDRLLESVQVVKDVRRAGELERKQACPVMWTNAIVYHRDFDDDEGNLREGGVHNTLPEPTKERLRKRLVQRLCDLSVQRGGESGLNPP
jgi:hypothetical protein